ncbi:ABC transporter ATP-binding protein [uncultured Thomasclavelia sp.]|uniref:ABC transporter ATP-binding protein n=1 Tax=uncultured Thomasclavelia sp. TaxID=3025759 RepID=UPI0025F31230|nr:ABC transporter ATP-binding protein [uncultured Thomasclavelia sp.]
MLELSNINIFFGKKECLIDGYFSAYPGQITAIVGESGVGKSSLLYMIGMLSDQSCNYYYNHQLLQYNEKQKQQFRNKNIAFIAQNSILIDTISVGKNIEFYLEDNHKNNVDEILAQVNLLEKKNAMVKSLSGGERQRVAIACALAKDANIILGDEITAALDLENKQLIMKLLKQEARKGKIIILVSHEEDIIDQCDCIYRFEHLELVLEKRNMISKMEQQDNKKEQKVSLLQTFEILFYSNRKDNLRRVILSFIVMILLFLSATIYVESNQKISFVSYDNNDIVNTRLLVLNDEGGFFKIIKLGYALKSLNSLNPLDDTVVKQLEQLEHVNSIYDYYQFDFKMFNNLGYMNQMGIQVLRDGNVVTKHQLTADDGMDSDDNYPFTVLPFYHEDGSDSEGIYINSNMAYYYNIEVGDTLKLEINVPYALARSASKLDATEINANPYYDYSSIGELVNYEAKVKGIIAANSVSDNEVYLFYDVMKKMIDEQVMKYHNGVIHINDDVYRGYSVIEELRPYAKVVYVDKYENVLVTQNEISTLSDTTFVYNEYQSVTDLENENNQMIKDTLIMMIIEIVIFIIGMIIIEIYYLKRYKNTYLMLKMTGYPASNRLYMIHYLYQLIIIFLMMGVIYLIGSIPLIIANNTQSDLYVVLASFPELYQKFAGYFLFSWQHFIFLAILSSSCLMLVHLLVKRYYDKQNLITWLRGK